jgi:hypothetical protein
MPASNDAIREIAKALRRHVEAATLEKIVNELLDVPGNRSFRHPNLGPLRSFQYF